MEDKIVFKTRGKKYKAKWQIILELIKRDLDKRIDNIKEYNKSLAEEADKIYNQQ